MAGRTKLTSDFQAGSLSRTAATGSKSAVISGFSGPDEYVMVKYTTVAASGCQRARGADGPRVSRLAASARLPESELFEARRAERDDPPDLAPGSRRLAGARRRAARHLDRPVALVRILGVGRGPSAGLGARGRHNRNRNPRPARSAHDDCEGGLV